MSKLTNFLADTPSKDLRTAPYSVKPSHSATGQAYWPVASKGSSTFAEAEVTRFSPTAGQSLQVQVRGALTSYYRYIGQTPSRKNLERNVKQITVHYQDLKQLGFDIQNVTSFGLKHAKALLGKWQANQCAPNTLYVRWSSLRTWARVLGKYGMLGKLSEVLPGFNRGLQHGNGYRILTPEQVAERSAFLESKPDVTVYLIDRLCRELGLTREEALQLDLDAVNAVVESDATVLRIGTDNDRKNIPSVRLNLPLLTHIRDFMVSRNRMTLAWSNLDLDAALQKYTLRLSYVTRTQFPETKRGAKAVTQEGGAE